MTPGLGMYRSLLRTINKTFKGDELMLNAACSELRTKFQENKNVTDPAVLKQRLQEGQEANEFIATSIVQAQRNPSTGEYEVDSAKAKRLKEAGVELAQGACAGQLNQAR